MAEHDEIVLLIPWHAAGTLDAAERARVDRHLAACADCRNLLEQARMQVELAGPGTPGSLLAHVEPGLLTRYVEQPAGLERETRRWIERKLAECEVCRDAHARLVEVERSLAAAEREASSPPAEPARGGWLAALWEALAASVLRPAPALAYLLLLALLVPLLLVREGVRGPVDPVPTLVRGVVGDRALRDSGGAAPAAMEIPGAGPVVLMLETELSAADVQRMSFRVELRRDGTVEWSAPVTAAGFDTTGGRVAYPLVLDPSRMAAGADYEISIRAVLPGDPVDGQALFRRRLRVVPGGGAR